MGRGERKTMGTIVIRDEVVSMFYKTWRRASSSCGLGHLFPSTVDTKPIGGALSIALFVIEGADEIFVCSFTNS